MRKLALFLFFLTALTATETTGKQLLEQISDAFTALADKARPATVSIQCVITTEGNYANPFDMFGDDFFKRFFGEQCPPRQQTAGGSGFLISSDGYIVTNNHVVKSASEITVTLNDGREYSATLKGGDPKTDLAVLKIEETDLPYLGFGDSEALRVGEWVVAAGNPFGLEGTITKGIVSAKGRQDLGIAPYEDFIQTDAAINPGNSGGPLLNVRGEVVGINTAIYSRSGGYMGIGLAIPSTMVKPVIEQIMAQGSVKRAYLGVILQPLDKDLSEAIGKGKIDGILVAEVLPDSPAAKAGLEQGDIITHYNEKPVKNVASFRNDIGVLPPNATLKLRILRNNKALTLTATLAAAPDESNPTELSQKLGLEFSELTPELAAKLNIPATSSGVVITGVKANSPAANAGLRPGFLITGLALDWTHQQPIKTIADLTKALSELGDRKHIILIIRHQNFQKYYTLKLG